MRVANGAKTRVLVIGAAGLIGSHVAEAFDRERVTRTHHSASVEGGITLDVSDATAVAALIDDVRPEVIVVAAAEPWVDRCEREPEVTRRINVEAARHVGECARAVGALLVVFSSEYVFDGAAGPYGEDDQVAPINEYGRQKVALEALARRSPRHLICRTSGAFGPERAGKNFVCQLVSRVRARERFRVPNDQEITPTYAPDLGRAVVDLARAGAVGTFHVAGPTIINRARFARTVVEVFALENGLLDEVPTAQMGYAAARPRRCGLQAARLSRTLGYTLRGPREALLDMRDREGSVHA